MEVKRLKIEIKRFKKSPKELHHQKKQERSAYCTNQVDGYLEKSYE